MMCDLCGKDLGEGEVKDIGLDTYYIICEECWKKVKGAL